ncbi:hypothetical protein, partial [Cyclobacterium sp.]|uniref:hypothetical protein n=1 Tax=Cyclobacterium sp. TaxID=1966343 RepID=UPI0039708466
RAMACRGAALHTGAVCRARLPEGTQVRCGLWLPRKKSAEMAEKSKQYDPALPYGFKADCFTLFLYNRNAANSRLQIIVAHDSYPFIWLGGEKHLYNFFNANDFFLLCNWFFGHLTYIMVCFPSPGG